MERKKFFQGPTKINMFSLHASSGILELSLSNKNPEWIFIISSLSLVEFFSCTLSVAAKGPQKKSV
jgi:hypothetical protein